MRISKIQVNEHLLREITKILQQAIADLKTPREVEQFLRAFLSEAEYITLAKRVGVVYWLDKGRSYGNINQNLKVSSATISSIQNNMNAPGIKLALQKIKAEEWATQWADKIQKFIKTKTS